MSFEAVPALTAGRAGIALAAVAAIVIVAARPAVARQAARRVATLAARLVARAGRLVLFAEHKLTRRRRLRGRAPLAPFVRVAALVDAKAITRADNYVERTSVAPVGRAVVATVVVAALAPSAAWLAMHEWPSSAVGRGVHAGFERWSSLEARAHIGASTNARVASSATSDTVETVTMPDANAGDSVVPVVRAATISRLAWTIVGADAVHLAGAAGDMPVPADYTGDGEADLATYRPPTGEWFFEDASLPTFVITAAGAPEAGDVPVPADYDGDGRAEPAVFRPSSGEWFIAGHSQPTALGAAYVPAADDVPVPADYDGHGRAEPMVFRPSTGQWFAVGAEPAQFGAEGDVPVPGAYAGAGHAVRAVFRPSSNEWLIDAGDPTPHVFGEDGDVPMVTDLDGDGVDEPTVFRPSFGDVIVHGRPVVETGAQDMPVVLRDRRGTRLATIAAAP